VIRKITFARESITQRRAIYAATLLCLIVAVSGCESFSNSPKPARIGEEQRYLVHLVTNSYESFGKIAKWYTGSEKSAKELAELNANVALNGLQVGESILIPFGSLKTVAPMPKTVGSKRGKSTKKGKKKEISSKVLESVELQSSEIEYEQTSPEMLEEEMHQNQPHVQSEKVDTQIVEEPEVLSTSQDRDVVPLPTAPEDEAKIGDNLGNGGKSLEDLVREEQAELERLKKEMGTQ
jgi:hypothetical protein